LLALNAGLMLVIQEVLEAALEFAQVQEATVGAVEMVAVEVNRAGLRQPVPPLTGAFPKQRMGEEQEASGD